MVTERRMQVSIVCCRHARGKAKTRETRRVRAMGTGHHPGQPGKGASTWSRAPGPMEEQGEEYHARDYFR